MLTQGRLKEVLDYNPENGHFRWRKGSFYNQGNERRAGSIDISNSHRSIFIEGNKYLEQTLVWLYVYGYFPEDNIYHIDGDKQNNRLINLKPANKSQTCQSKNKQSNNTSGFKGVSFCKSKERWRATIRVNKKLIHLGYFTCLEKAAQAYKEAAIKYFGEFARYD